jgi:hypothetical protein
MVGMEMRMVMLAHELAKNSTNPHDFFTSDKLREWPWTFKVTHHRSPAENGQF